LAVCYQKVWADELAQQQYPLPRRWIFCFYDTSDPFAMLAMASVEGSAVTMSFSLISSSLITPDKTRNIR
ncbi:MAG: hypothetical protein WBS14_09495, partial [Rhodomicrobium sp.]